jgi:hypothetical protein
MLTIRKACMMGKTPEYAKIPQIYRIILIVYSLGWFLAVWLSSGWLLICVISIGLPAWVAILLGMVLTVRKNVHDWIMTYELTEEDSRKLAEIRQEMKEKRRKKFTERFTTPILIFTAPGILIVASSMFYHDLLWIVTGIALITIGIAAGLLYTSMKTLPCTTKWEVT